MTRFIGACLLLALLTACGGPIQSVELHGYHGDLLQVKYLYEIAEHQLANGKEGFRQVTTFRYSKGARERLDVITTADLEPDYTLHRLQRLRDEGVSRTVFEYHFEDGEIVKTITGPDGLTSEERKAVEGPVYVDIPPLKYATELTEPGDEKTYRIFDTNELTFSEVLYRYVGLTEVESAGKQREVRRYQVQSATSPDGFTDYFLDPGSLEYVRIEMSPVVFQLP